MSSSTPPAGARRACFLSYGSELSSFRHRMRPVIAALAGAGWSCTAVELPPRPHLMRVLRLAAPLRGAELLVISKVEIGPPESWLLRRWARRIVYDVDDAVYVRKPRRAGAAPQRPLGSRAKYAACCRMADLVVAGNPTVAAEARRYARRVEVLDTPVDVDAYPEPDQGRRAGGTLVWIGMPGNLFYLEPLRPVLARLAREHPDLKLRVVCSRFPDWDDVPIEPVTWSAATEADALLTAGVGVMPLFDDEWSRGKGAFKLKQYMAASLPAVASPVGINAEVVVPGVTGYLASPPEEWDHALRELLASPERRRAMGAAARQRALALYDRRVFARRMVELYNSL